MTFLYTQYIFQHALVEAEAENLRSRIKNAGPLMGNLLQELNDAILRLGKNVQISKI